jgi:3-deoxy-alpha-D-manno-octulosonate 8-oxidase
LFGRSSLERLSELLPETRSSADYCLFVIDKVHQPGVIPDRLPVKEGDVIEWFDAVKEPATWQVDDVRDRVLKQKSRAPACVIGIGGGSTMDVAKAVSVVFTNEGSSSLYQGWDLVKVSGIRKIGVPTLAGSGAEASRTAVLMGKDKKFGINSDYSMFDAILLDSTLIEGVPSDQRFHSGMDCYIHCAESLQGTMINELARAYATRAIELCRNVFLGNGDGDELMVASYMGGCSVVNSEVGVCHALSYGLSLELGYRHGLANCLAFDVLDEFYPDHVAEFREIMRRHRIVLPKGVTKKLDDKAVGRMIDMTLRMERPLTNALGENWQDILTRRRIVELYSKI